MTGLLAVCRFELNRIATPGRFVWWLVVASFPVVITLLLSRNPGMQMRDFSPEERRQWEQQIELRKQRRKLFRELEEIEAALFDLRRQSSEEQQERRFEAPHDVALRMNELISRRNELQRIYSQMATTVGRPRRRFISPENIQAIYLIAIYFLGPTVACMLGALLTASPAVATELEQRSWIYLATRPNGLFQLVVGKYIVAVGWSATAAVVGVTGAVLVSGVPDALATAGVMGVLAVLSALCYAALFIMIGTLFPQRAMVFCVAYTAGVELFLGALPAVINRLTVQYRLRSLLVQWTSLRDRIEDIEDLPLVNLIALDESSFLQVLWLVAFAVLFLAIGLTTLQVREFTTASESDV